MGVGSVCFYCQTNTKKDDSFIEGPHSCPTCCNIHQIKALNLSLHVQRGVSLFFFFFIIFF